jgi:Leucine-rich repeat (LRR) protein
MTDAADKAYEVAKALIAKAKQKGSPELDLSRKEFWPLTHLPPEIADLTALTELDLANTQVADLSLVAGLTALTVLYLSNTQVADLSPVADLTALTGL